VDDPLGRLAEILEEVGIEYALIGGHAVNAWVEPRFTADIDVTIEAAVAPIERLAAALQREGFTLAGEHGADPVAGPDFLRFVSDDGRVVLEFQAAKTELQDAVIRWATSDSRGLRVATPEDRIVLKLIANRTKDQIDLLGLCALPELDWAYVERWASEWRAQVLRVVALHRAFREYFDQTWTDYLRTVRLNTAHRDLLVADPAQVSFTVIAGRHGFYHLGRFAGEPPRETFARGH
jgi:hypothetical protein